MLSRQPHRLIAPLVSWCVDQVAAEPPRLVGAIPGRDSISLQLVELEPGDPVSDLAELVAPECWTLAVLVSSARLWRCRDRVGTGARFAYGFDRLGHSVLEIRSNTGYRSIHHDIAGPLRSICSQIMNAHC